MYIKMGHNAALGKNDSKFPVPAKATNKDKWITVMKEKFSAGEITGGLTNIIWGLEIHSDRYGGIKLSIESYLASKYSDEPREEQD